MRAVFVSLFALAAVAASPAAAADWIKATTPNFVIYTDVSEAEARRYADTLELFDAVLRARHGLPTGRPSRRPLPIYLLARSRDLSRISPGIHNRVAGFYTSSLEDTFAVATYDRRDDSTILHEYAHHFMYQNFPFSFPGWLVEGYAEYFMTMKVDAEHFYLGNVNKNRADWLVYGDPLSYERMLGVRPFELKLSSQLGMYYAQAWSLTHYLYADPERRQKFGEYLKLVSEGGDPVQSMTKATGRSPKQLRGDVQRYLTRGFPFQKYNRVDVRTPPATVERLPAGAGELMLMAQRIKGDNGLDAPEDRTDGPVLLREARELAARYPTLREADLVRARIELKLGDPAEAERVLSAMLARDPSDVEALLLSSEARLQAAEKAEGDRRATLFNEARGFAGRAFKADPNRYQVLVAYVRAREEIADYPTENDVRVLEDALSLAPQVDSLRLATATALIARDKRDEAIRLLRPLLGDPHPGEGTEEARRLLEGLGDPAAQETEETAAAE